MKGKYAARAARRREDESVQSEIETYQRNVKRLTDENNKLTETLAAERAARKEEVRRLKVQLDEGLSPEVVALRAELERQREKAGKAEADRQRTRELWSRTFDGIRRLLMDGLGLTNVEALEVILFLDPDAADRDPVFIADASFGVRNSPGLTREKALAIAAANGHRHHTDIVKLLRDKIAELAAS